MEIFSTAYHVHQQDMVGGKWALSLFLQNNSICTLNPGASSAMNLDIAEFEIVYSRRFSFSRK
jgi:hypothetical protein